MIRKLSICALALAVTAPALAHGPHAHGVAELRVALDGATLHIELDTPLDNLVGFEHAPRTARQREALAKAEERLGRAEGLFVLPAAAGCALQSAEVVSPFSPQAAGDHGHGHAHAKDEAHSDLQASYSWACSAPAALKELEVMLFDAFPRLRRVRAETATPGGQGSATLDKSKRKLPL